MSRLSAGLLRRAAGLARDAREHLPAPVVRRLGHTRSRSRLRSATVVDMPDPGTVTVTRGTGAPRTAASRTAESRAAPSLTAASRTAESRTAPSRAAAESGTALPAPSRSPAGTVRRSLDPRIDSGPPERVDGRVVLTVPDPAALVRLASAGLLAGSVDGLRVLITWSPPWLRAGAPGIRPDSSLSELRLRVRGQGLEVVLGWSRPAGITAALDAVLRVVLRTRTGPRHGGPLPAVDRAGWVAGAWTWPDGLLVDERPAPASTGPGPLGPVTDPVTLLPVTLLPAALLPATLLPATGAARPVAPVVTAVAFPWRRRLLGEPAAYRLTGGEAGQVAVVAGGDPGDPGRSGSRSVAVFDGRTGVERVVAGGRLVRYATAVLPEQLLGTPPSAGSTPDLDTVLLALAAVGVVTVATGPRGRQRLAALGLPFPDDVGAVSGPEGYAWSAAVSRAAGIEADPTLRQHLGAGSGAITVGAALPTVSVLIASMRPDQVPGVLTDLAGQTWPDFEVVLGTHGWLAGPADLAAWADTLDRPVRAVAADTAVPFGEVLGRLSRLADGDLLTKVDDDDVYGPDHLTDLVLALRTAGADLVSKAPRFVHLAEAGVDPRGGRTGRTVDRSWAASEVLDTTPAGGTLMFPRSTLLTAGGWSGSLRHVDIDVTARIRRAGGVTYRSHGLGYTWVRHERGHTWDVDQASFLEQAGEVYDGLPAALAVGRPAALRRGLTGWAGGMP